MSKTIYLILVQTEDSLCCAYASFSKTQRDKVLKKYRKLFENNYRLYYDDEIVVEKDYISKYERELKEDE